MAKKKAQGVAQEGPKGVQNRRARYDYEFLDTVEAGVVLAGAEVKSVYLGNAHLTDAYCVFRDGELWLVNMDIEPYTHASHFQPERRRDRKLLLHRRELNTLERKSLEKGLALIPARAYFVRGKVKIEVALARGKRQYDKRQQIAKDETRREAERIQRGRGFDD